MIILPGTSDILRVVTSAAVATDVQLNYVDVTTTTVAASRQLTAISTAATTTICSAPAASTQRTVKQFTICARGGAQTVVLQYFDGATAYQFLGGTTFALAQGDTLQYTDTDGFSVFPAGGITSGRLLSVQYVNAGTVSIAHAAGAVTSVIEGVGGGASAAGAAGASTVSGGGGSGTWGSKRITLVGLSSTCVVGAAGTGSTGLGANGADTTFTHNGVTMTLPGGVAGARLAGLGAAAGVVAATAAAAAATNADISITGQGGGPGFKPVAAVQIYLGGIGGSNPLGQGGPAVAANATLVAGNSGTGFGSGSSGPQNATAAGTSAAPSGQPGILIVSDYS
jgi:hypothetical protein